MLCTVGPLKVSRLILYHLGMVIVPILVVEGTEVQRGGLLVQNHTGKERAEILIQGHRPLRHPERGFCKGHWAHCNAPSSLPKAKVALRIWTRWDLFHQCTRKPPSGPVHQPQGRGTSLHQEGDPAPYLQVGLFKNSFSTTQSSFNK